MFSRLFFIIFLLIGFTNCGFFAQKVESLVEKNENPSPDRPNKSQNKILYCPEEIKTQILFEDESAINFYNPILKLNIENKNYSFIQRAAMYSLMEMLRRPDTVTPKSRVQFFLRLKSKDYYFDITNQKSNTVESYPFLKGIDLLLKNFESQIDLKAMASLLDANMPKDLTVDPSLENFLQKHKDEISNNDELSEYFIKGDEVITKHESFKKFSLKKIIQMYKTQNFSLNKFYDFKENSALKDIGSSEIDAKILCNLNITQEDRAPQKYSDSQYIPRNHYFAIKEGDNVFIAAVSSYLPKKIKNIKGTYFIDSLAAPNPLPFCEFKSKVQDILLFSTEGRYPSQHLGHLVNYEINKINNSKSLLELLKFSRHLFLSNPDRILYESKKGRKTQLDFFLNMNFPIYHVSNLGNIFGMATFKSQIENSSGLIIDDRSNALIRCNHR